MQKEERDMLRLSQKEVSDEDIEKHCEKYSWIHFGWTGPSLDIAYFKGVCEGLHKEGESKETLEKILNKDKQLVIDKEKIIKDLEIDEHMQKLFRLLEEILYIKALRMDSLFISYEATQPLLKKIAKDNFLSLPQVYVLYYDWLIDMIKNNKIDAHKINKIAQYSSRYFDGEEDYLLVGDEARELVSQVRKNIPKEKKSDELKGECAFPGKVSGKVKIVNHADEMNKFEEGDILISYVTDPSLLPAMKKAKAFVTNTGGLTCHAAIVARELEVPCVIGTKIATKVLKDGDMVEVDATNGIVKKIK
ncbi:hypothetical protein C0581_00850 [Candidatus Parcubacteria bacterium]|nr:MAG: hypothetical protein C0581_00850 [Candidatus Parcubacteria bacterium]